LSAINEAKSFLIDLIGEEHAPIHSPPSQYMRKSIATHLQLASKRIEANFTGSNCQASGAEVCIILLGVRISRSEQLLLLNGLGLCDWKALVENTCSLRDQSGKLQSAIDDRRIPAYRRLNPFGLINIPFHSSISLHAPRGDPGVECDARLGTQFDHA